MAELTKNQAAFTKPIALSKRKMNVQAWRETLAGYVFIGPMLIFLIIFTIIPILLSLVLSFTDWSFVSPIQEINFVGLQNYKTLTQDDVFLTSAKNNLVLVLVVPVTMMISLILSIVIHKHVYFKDLFKVIYFMPYISSVVAVAIVFQVLFHPSFGPVNQMLTSIGIDNPPMWLADMDYALPSVMMIMVWIGIGFNLIIYMAALQSIPGDLYEAADIDGANGWVKFRSITLPLVSPTSFFLLITGIISSFKVFDLIAVLTQGGPAHSTSVVVYYLYTSAFESLKTGYASSIAWFLFLGVFLITLIQWYGQKKWVNY
ncbi:sugar ABC transporter permease [Paenibacillus swuensis]|uniref:Sugar ABC transporter permease n=2 Tax=Paenibacillus swuensis TaxID=1178515 RepID=A0A172TFA3_9BACL|nr:sugar ABC transporter permease [Paenibacillus swuensis]